MQPKTIFQKRVVEVSQKLQPINQAQRTWAEKHVLLHVAFRSKRKTNCMDCGHQWKTGDSTLLINKLVTTCTCPECGEKLTIKDTNERVTAQRLFYSVIDRQDEFQIVRMFELRSFHKTGEQREVSFVEVCGQFILPETGAYEIIAMLRGGMGYYDTFNGYLEIRGKHSFFEKYNIEPDGIYPKMKVCPLYKRNGFKGDFHGNTPHNLFTKLGHCTQAETLLKRKETGFLLALCLGKEARQKQVIKYWPSIRIVMRHGYKVTEKQVCDYLDYLDLLDFFKEDLNSPHFVCPASIKRAHDAYVAKKQAYHERERLEQQRAKMAEEQILFEQMKGMFFGLEIVDGQITITPIKSVQEVYEHGKMFHHCVYTNNYYKRPDSLLLSANIDGQAVETIEVDLKSMKIIQARGLQNKSHEKHEAIVAVMNKNLPIIKKVYNKTKKQAA